MPLDAAAVTQDTANFAGAELAGAPVAAAPTLGGAASIGAALRAAREFRGLSRQDLADSTRIRSSYLAALEDMKVDALPSRPFTIGYVRAYAQALGMDPDEAVAKFKRDVPVTLEPLRAPIGVSRERDPRLTLVAGAAALVLTAVLVWNLAQHAVAQDEPAKAAVSDAVAAGPATPPVASGTPVVLSASEPAPQDSDVPAPYVTPGLPPIGQNGAAGVAAPVTTEAVADTLAPGLPIFRAKGAIFGAAANVSTVTLQARKAASLIVRGGDGTVYFARQLAIGQAYRAPMLKGLTVEVSDPLAFNVYNGGTLKGSLPAAQTTVEKLAG
jgi:cytoskeleton protein RodZ